MVRNAEHPSELRWLPARTGIEALEHSGLRTFRYSFLYKSPLPCRYFLLNAGLEG